MSYYLAFGIVLTLCLGIAVKYMPKYNAKEVILCITAWTIIATSSAAAFILAYHTMQPVIPTQQIDVVAGIEPTQIRTEPDTPEKTKEEIEEIQQKENDRLMANWEEEVRQPNDEYFSTDVAGFYKAFERMYWKSSKTSLQKNQILKEYSNKRVYWTGTVKDVNNNGDDYWHIVLRVPGSEDDVFFAYFRNPSESLKQKLIELKIGKEVTIEGTTDLAAFSWTLDNSKIMEE